MPITADLLLGHIDYSIWATNRVLDACAPLTDEELRQDLKVSHGGVLLTLQHIYYADRVWLARLEDRTINFADDGGGPSLAELSSMWPSVLKDLRDYVASLTDEMAEETFGYKNLAGEEKRLKRGQAILHVVNHATLHRGQVVAMLRQLGHQPPQTDLIYYYLS